MDPTDPTKMCQIASGMEFLKELGSPDVVQDFRNLHSALYGYLDQCPKMTELTGSKYPEGHWWWGMVAPFDADTSMTGSMPSTDETKCKTTKAKVRLQ